MLYAVISCGPLAVCAKTAPPWLVWLLKVAFAGNTYGELMVLCCARTSIDEVSKRVGPERKREPSEDTATTGEITAMLRLARIVEDAASKTKAVRVLLARS